jgi:hypothetical protein
MRSEQEEGKSRRGEDTTSGSPNGAAPSTTMWHPSPFSPWGRPLLPYLAGVALSGTVKAPIGMSVMLGRGPTFR